MAEARTVERLAHMSLRTRKALVPCCDWKADAPLWALQIIVTAFEARPSLTVGLFFAAT